MTQLSAKLEHNLHSNDVASVGLWLFSHRSRFSEIDSIIRVNLLPSGNKSQEFEHKWQISQISTCFPIYCHFFSSPLFIDSCLLLFWLFDWFFLLSNWVSLFLTWAKSIINAYQIEQRMKFENIKTFYASTRLPRTIYICLWRTVWKKRVKNSRICESRAKRSEIIGRFFVIEISINHSNYEKMQQWLWEYVW